MRRTVLAAVMGTAVLATAVLGAACSGSDPNIDADGATDSAGDAGSNSETPGSEPQSSPVASPGCDAGPVESIVGADRSITVDGVARRYLITVPEPGEVTEPVPIVFDFHGLMEGADIHSTMSGYSEVAQQEGFVVVFPEGTGQPLRWDTSGDPSTNADLAFFDALLEEVGNTACIDTSRVYATGLSNGAMFTSYLICERSEVLAAAAPVAGLTDFESCTGAQPVPLLAIHGTADPILLFNGGVDVGALQAITDPDAGEATIPKPTADLDGEGYPASVRAFAARNGCEPEPDDSRLSAEVIHRTYECPPGADVEFYIVEGGGHSWPSSEFSRSIEAIVGHTTFDIDATRDAWAFMSQFTRR